MKVDKKTYKGISYDSEGEVDFVKYLEELRLAGLVTSWSRAGSVTLTAGLYHKYKEVTKLKTKTKEVYKDQTLLEPSVYTPDFVVLWSTRAEGKFFQGLDSVDKITCPFIAQAGMPCYVECKPGFDYNNMSRLFRNNQKFMWEKYHVFVNLVTNEALFKATFTPADVYVPIKRDTKKPAWQKTSLKSYLASK